MGRTWRVTGQEELPVRVGLRSVPGVVVSYVDSSGLSGSVDVPLSEYTADRVAKLIGDRVAQHEAVAGLGSVSGGS